MRLTTQEHAAELVVDEPLIGYSFAVVWTPADNQRYKHRALQVTPGRSLEDDRPLLER